MSSFCRCWNACVPALQLPGNTSDANEGPAGDDGLRISGNEDEHRKRQDASARAFVTKKASMRQRKAVRNNNRILGDVEAVVSELLPLTMTKTSTGGLTRLVVAGPPVKWHPHLPTAPLLEMTLSGDGPVFLKNAPDSPPTLLGTLVDLEMQLPQILMGMAMPSTPCLGCGDAATERYDVSRPPVPCCASLPPFLLSPPDNTNVPFLPTDHSPRLRSFKSEWNGCSILSSNESPRKVAPAFPTKTAP